MIHVGRFLSFFFFERKGGLETAVDYQGTLHFDISWEQPIKEKPKKRRNRVMHVYSVEYSTFNEKYIFSRALINAETLRAGQ